MNKAMSLTQGWKTFLWVLFNEQDLTSLAHAAEWMYRLNVTARAIGRHPITDQIYELKNELVKYLYQHGFCTELKLHSQKRMCRSCDGTGDYYGQECDRCDGSGVYAVTPLYAFRFEIEGKRYAWHQLRRLVDFPVALTQQESGDFIEPQVHEDAVLKLQDAWLGCCVVWWCLKWHGVTAELRLFSQTRMRIRTALKLDVFSMWRYRVRIAWLGWINQLRLKWQRRSRDPLKDMLIMVEPDEMEYYAREMEERMTAHDYDENEIPF